MSDIRVLSPERNAVARELAKAARTAHDEYEVQTEKGELNAASLAYFTSMLLTDLADRLLTGRPLDAVLEAREELERTAAARRALELVSAPSSDEPEHDCCEECG